MRHLITFLCFGCALIVGTMTQGQRNVQPGTHKLKPKEDKTPQKIQPKEGASCVCAIPSSGQNLYKHSRTARSPVTGVYRYKKHSQSVPNAELVCDCGENDAPPATPESTRMHYKRQARSPKEGVWRNNKQSQNAPELESNPPCCYAMEAAPAAPETTKMQYPKRKARSPGVWRNNKQSQHSIAVETPVCTCVDVETAPAAPETTKMQYPKRKARSPGVRVQKGGNKKHIQSAAGDSCECNDVTSAKDFFKKSRSPRSPKQGILVHVSKRVQNAPKDALECDCSGDPVAEA